MSLSDRFLLLGVGGAGGRIANHVAQATGGLLASVAIDTDFAAVAQLGLCRQIRVGHSRFDGAGSGGNATLSRMAIDEESDAIRKLFTDVQVAIVVTGLGGGTGSGVTPTVLRVARDLNVRTLVFATLPFSFEGSERRALANRTCPQLDEVGDVVALFENDALCSDTFDAPMGEALTTATRTLSAGLTLLWRMAGTPGYIGLDFATLAGLLQCGRGRATFAFAAAQGERRFESAVSELLDHPRRGIRKALPTAPAMLIGVIGGEDLRLKEVGDVVGRLQLEADTDCDMRLGTVLDPGETSSLSLAVLLFRSWTHEMREAPSLSERDPPPSLAPSSGSASGPAVVARPVRSRSKPSSTPTSLLTGNRFRNTSETVFGGENLDVPTFLRRGLRIDAE